MPDALFAENLQYLVFLALALGTAIGLGLIAFSKLRYDGPETRALRLFTLLGLGFVLTNALELLAPTEAGTLFFARLAYLFTSLLPVAWLAFALALSGRAELARKPALALLLLVPLATNLVAWLPHHLTLLWKAYRFRQALGLPLLTAEGYGPWFWVQFVHNYGLILTGSLLLLREYLGRGGPFRRQSGWMVAGVLLPLLVNALYVFRLAGLEKDFTAVGFGLSAFCFWAGIKREGLLDVVPVARHSVVEEMPDPVLVLDRRGMVADYNPAAAALLGPLVLGKAPTGLAGLGIDGRALGNPGTWEMQVSSGEGERRVVYELRSYPVLAGAGDSRGRVLAFRDATSQARLLADKDRLIAELRQTAAEVKHLRGIIPICASCKKVRDDEGYWRQVEDYIEEHSEADFSHGLCPDCLEKYLPKD